MSHCSLSFTVQKESQLIWNSWKCHLLGMPLFECLSECFFFNQFLIFTKEIHNHSKYVTFSTSDSFTAVREIWLLCLSTATFSIVNMTSFNFVLDSFLENLWFPNIFIFMLSVNKFDLTFNYRSIVLVCNQIPCKERKTKIDVLVNIMSRVTRCWQVLYM